MFINFESIPVGTPIFDQLPGLRFPSTPRVVRPSMGSLLGDHALSNTAPGEEFNPQPLTIEFSTAQSRLRLVVGMDQSSMIPIQATLRGFDNFGNLLVQDGPISIGPGPTPIRTVMQVQSLTPTIERAVLEYSLAFVEVISSLEFDNVGLPDELDTEPPKITIIEPVDGANLTGETFLLQVEVEEQRKLRSVNLTIQNDLGEQGTEIAFSGIGPIFGVGPTLFGSLAEGPNTITVRAEDFAGNANTASVSVRRVPIAGQIKLPSEPIAVPRLSNSVNVPVDLDETFPGSLNGRGDIGIRVTNPQGILGSGTIRDSLNQPLPHLDLAVQAWYSFPLGRTKITVQATEQSSGRILSTADFRASVTPGRSIACGANTFPFYITIPLADLTRRINDAFDENLPDGVDTIGRADVQYGRGTLNIFHRFLYHPTIETEIHFYAELRPRLSSNAPRDILFEYDLLDVNAAPKFTIVDIITASIWAGVQSSAEGEFRARFREPLRQRLGQGITSAIEQINPLALVVLSDIYVTTDEFGLGFCIPANLFDSFGS